MRAGYYFAKMHVIVGSVAITGSWSNAKLTLQKVIEA
jgi:hypothetical protein